MNILIQILRSYNKAQLMTSVYIYIQIIMILGTDTVKYTSIM